MRQFEDKPSQLIVTIDLTDNEELKELKKLLTSALQQVEELIGKLEKLRSS